MRKTGKIGTTGRGIGPAYQDRAQRRALRGHVLADDPALGFTMAAEILLLIETLPP